MPDRLPPNPSRHSVTDDVQGLFLGIMLCGFGLLILASAGLVTGQTAGLAALIARVTGYGFGVTFFAINIPFYALAFRRMGLRFTVKSFGAVAGVSLLTVLLPRYVSFDLLNPLVAAVLFGLISGMGLLALFRHGASLGGVGMVAIYVQDIFGIRAGWFQLGFDAVLFAVAFALLDPLTVAYSVTGAIVLNLVIAMNHRRDRYIAR